MAAIAASKSKTGNPSTSEEEKGTSNSQSSRKEEKSLSSKLAAISASRKSKTLNTSENEVSHKKEEYSGPCKGTQFIKSETKDKDTRKYKLNYWAEVYLEKEKKWISVDVLTGKVNNPSDIESRLPKPVIYVFAVNSEGKIKDVTRRYSSNFLASSKKLRIDQKWVDTTLRPFIDTDNDEEDREMIKKSEEAPLPTSVEQFKVGKGSIDPSNLLLFLLYLL